MTEVNADDVRSAAARLHGQVHRTPVLTSRTLDERVGATVLLKCENFQRMGAFKFRGAYHMISRLPADQLRRGVCTFSSGNHGQAVALAARALGTTATVLMPTDAPESKAAAVRGYGGKIQHFDRYQDDRAALCARLAEENGLAQIPPYDHPDIIAGQGTAAKELWEDAGPLDVLMTPMGGGGLMAGTALLATEFAPEITVVGVEPADGDDQRQSLAAGHRVTIGVPRTIADGLALATPGALTFEINRRLLTEVTTVRDEEIMDAMRWLFDRMKLVVEPSAAVVVAALLSGRVRFPGKRVGLIISGGNISAERFAALLGSGD